MLIVATAGHVDHGKSTLVRALTGMEPDRWAEERRRGMTIDLGYAWTQMPSGHTVAFVDVPGHERFLGNMLAGLGPVAHVLFVVAADEGWRAQSAEHLQAVDALGLTSGLLVVTRSDLADPAPALAAAADHLRRSSLGDTPAISISARTGQGLPELGDALDRMAATERIPDPGVPLRLWIDRRFTVRGSGTVVTGTLSAGTVRVGDELRLGGRSVRVRGLQSLGRAMDVITGPARVALNLRAVEIADVSRGDTLISPGSWHRSPVLDVRLSTVPDRGGQVLAHLGTSSMAAHLRPLGADTARLHLSHPLPLRPGDRGLLTDPTTRRITTGFTVLDVDPPELRRRGSATARAHELTGSEPPDVLSRRGALRRTAVVALGLGVHPDRAAEIGDWVVTADRLERWADRLRATCQAQREREPMRPGLSDTAAVSVLELPDAALLPAVVTAAGLRRQGGFVFLPGTEPTLGRAEEGLRQLEEWLIQDPFNAPTRPQLLEWGLQQRELATAARLGRILRLGPDIVLAPEAPDQAVRQLGDLPQPFSTSQARQRWNTTRRVAIPLLEYLDAGGRTERVSPDLRRLRD